MARRELLALGCSRREIGRRIDAGRLFPIHRGVYAVGHPALTWHARAHAAQALRLTTPTRIRKELGPHANRLSALLDTTEPTRSELERALTTVIRQAGLPRPRMNAPVGPYTVDALWPDKRVIVEVDGWAAHGHRAAFERDRARDADLQARGYTVIRFTWRQVTGEPLRVATRIAQVLARA